MEETAITTMIPYSMVIMRETALETCAPTFPQGVLYERFFSKSHFLIGHWHIISEAEAKKKPSASVSSQPDKAVVQLPQGWVPAGYLSGNGEALQSAQTALASSHRGGLTLIYKKI